VVTVDDVEERFLVSPSKQQRCASLQFLIRALSLRATTEKEANYLNGSRSEMPLMIRIVIVA